MAKKVYDLDNTDKQILSILSKDSKVPYAEIGAKLFVSVGTVHARIKKMIDAEIIKGSQVVFDHDKLGYDITAFLGIYFERSNMYDKVSSELLKITEVVEAHYTTGIYGIFAKIICKDTDHLRAVISGKIQFIDGIQRTETFISLHESIRRPLEILPNTETD